MAVKAAPPEAHDINAEADSSATGPE
jgi:hypothetical protein